MISSRRRFLGVALSCLPLLLMGARSRPGVSARQAGPASTPQGAAPAADTLMQPIGEVSATGPLDNNPQVIAIERRLRCTCGCTLDVYTCRTTDFACTYSPAMHHAVVARFQHGDSAQVILDAFVAEYGESVLMAPPARGFNLAGYLVPGLLILAALLALVAWLRHRELEARLAAAGSGASNAPGEGERSGSGSAGRGRTAEFNAQPAIRSPGHPLPSSPPLVGQANTSAVDGSVQPLSADEEDRLQRALDQVES